jgi:hypothetical protein
VRERMTACESREWLDVRHTRQKAHSRRPPPKNRSRGDMASAAGFQWRVARQPRQADEKGRSWGQGDGGNKFGEDGGVRAGDLFVSLFVECRSDAKHTHNHLWMPSLCGFAAEDACAWSE